MVGIVVVDGTGPGTDSAYDEQYRYSNCSAIANWYPNATYTRGPNVQASNLQDRIDEAFSNAEKAISAPNYQGLCLIGHSRGGAAVITVARMLEEKGHEVGFMGLLDAVEMDLSFKYDVDTVPKNVKRVIHVMRSFGTMSRISWGNCGEAWEGGTMTKVSLWATHGSIGGVPPKMTEQNKNEYIKEDYGLLTRVTIEQGHAGAKKAYELVVENMKAAIRTMESGPPPKRPVSSQPGKCYPEFGRSITQPPAYGKPWAR